MVVDIQEAYNLMGFLKKLKPEIGVNVARQMVGKFKGIIPEGTSSVDFLKKVRESQYD
ncbi:MAG: hypothetical protein OIN86_06230 [Candidatus Methanoperedens sp.]|jgi:hypothetical protein|nr:hypothetical protein [Candidatus Methanoperedens sp.]CAG0954306.1 hypothetical protein METP1_00358 [Methanosarcinales archaeon]